MHFPGQPGGNQDLKFVPIIHWVLLGATQCIPGSPNQAVLVTVLFFFFFFLIFGCTT